ncbi:MAG: hypothetical protein ACXVX5_08480 [Mycobacterium sp.]
MKVKIKSAVAVFCGMAALAVTVGFGVSPTGGAATHPSSGSTPARTVATGAGAHLATLASCVSGLDC